MSRARKGDAQIVIAQTDVHPRPLADRNCHKLLTVSTLDRMRERDDIVFGADASEVGNSRLMTDAFAKDRVEKLEGVVVIEGRRVVVGFELPDRFAKLVLPFLLVGKRVEEPGERRGGGVVCATASAKVKETSGRNARPAMTTVETCWMISSLVIR